MNEDLFNLGIKALIRNKKGQILLLKVSDKEMSKVTDWKGDVRYDIPGGRIKIGDTVEQTLVREVMEETGLVVKSFNLLTSVVSNIRLKNELVGDIGLILSIYEVVVNEKTINLDDENTGYEWLSPKLTAEKLSTKYPREFIEIVSKLD